MEVTISVGLPRVLDPAEIPSKFSPIKIGNLWNVPSGNHIRPTCAATTFYTCRVPIGVYVKLLEGRASKSDVLSWLGFREHDDAFDIHPGDDFLKGTALAAEVYDVRSGRWKTAGEPPARGLGYRTMQSKLPCVGYARPFSGHFLYLPLPLTLCNDSSDMLMCQTLTRYQPSLMGCAFLVKPVLKKAFPGNAAFWDTFPMPPPPMTTGVILSLSIICMRQVLKQCEAILVEKNEKKKKKKKVAQSRKRAAAAGDDEDDVVGHGLRRSTRIRSKAA
jgi:hypothetical protein